MKLSACLDLQAEHALLGYNNHEVDFTSHLAQVPGNIERVQNEAIARRRVVSQTREDLFLSWALAALRYQRRDHPRHARHLPVRSACRPETLRSQKSHVLPA